ncbi:hypothetical protein PINS_up000959 [Pythium insidiosum]|nr:hypothetical protein PINS_up000959 [Pythium insidiosum]
MSVIVRRRAPVVVPRSIAYVVPQAPTTRIKPMRATTGFHWAEKSASATETSGFQLWKLRVRRLLCSLHAWKTEHQYLGRYSIEKLQQLDTYCRQTSRTRAALVVMLWPLPTLLLVALFHAVPLGDPGEGAASNMSFFVRSAIEHSVLGAMLILSLQQTLRLTPRQYPAWKIILIAGLTGLSNEIVWASIAFLWRFPVPYRELLGTPSWVLFAALYHVLLLRPTLRLRRAKFLLYLPIMATQLVILFGCLTLSLVFALVSSEVQVLMILLFPIVKIQLKRKIWSFARRLDDLSTDVTICLVEFAGSLFQTLCLQHAQSALIASVVTLVDAAQAILEVWLYMEHPFFVDGRQTLTTAMKIVEGSLFPAGPEFASPHHRRREGARRSSLALPTGRKAYATPRRASTAMPMLGRSSSVFLPPRLVVRYDTKTMLNLRTSFSTPLDHGITHQRATTPRSEYAEPTRGRPSFVVIDGVAIVRRDQARVLEQSLQLLFSCEVLLFVECMEVAMPLLYGT